MAKRLLLLEDDQVLRHSIATMLREESYEVELCGSLTSYEELPERVARDIDLYILDVCLPDGNGFDFCKRIRRETSTPILMLTVLDDEDSIVKGLDYGADDYVVKPFSLKILKYRIRALLRRNQDNVVRLHSGDYVFHIDDCAVYKEGLRVELLPKEFQITRVLLAADGSLVTRRTLLEKIWDIDGVFVDDNTLSVHMSRLRKKLGKYNGISYVETERGFGYRWGVRIERYE